MTGARTGQWRTCVAVVYRRRELLLVALAVVAVFASRFAYLPSTLEDIDSVNFDLGVHRFDPSRDQPHPPGYAVFIGIAKVVHPFFASHSAGLAFPSVVFSALLVLPLYVLFRGLVGRPPAAMACALLIFNPLFWINSVRPMSDVTGFAAVIGAQCLLVSALGSSSDARRWRALHWCLGVALAGLAIGVRVQAAVLVGPILTLGLLRLPHLAVQTVAVFGAACAAWLVPTAIASGGLQRLLARQASVVAEAWPSEPLVSGITLDRMYHAAVNILAAPWGSPWLAGTALVAALCGLALMWRTERRSLYFLLLLYGPYALYHYALQQTGGLRYSIPILPIIVVPASVAIYRVVRTSPRGLASVGAVFVLMAMWVTTPALGAFAAGPSPPAGAVHFLRELAQADRQPVVAGNYVFDRYLSELGRSTRVMRTKPNQEWRALTRLWVDGEAGPVWFLRDPARSLLHQMDPEALTRVAAWRWPDSVSRLIRGARPTRVELVRLDPPRWFARSGFFLTTDWGPADEVSRQPHLLYVRPDGQRTELSISGRASRPTDVTMMVVGEPRRRWRVSNDFSVRVAVPPASGTSLYVPVRLEATAPLLLTAVSVDPDGGEVWLPTAGFHASEVDELGRTFRWISPSADITVSGSGTPMRLTLRGQLPIDYYHLPVTVRASAPGWQGQTYQVTDRDFRLAIDLPPAEAGSQTLVTLSTSQSFVPDAIERNGDMRLLSMRVYEIRAARGTPVGVVDEF